MGDDNPMLEAQGDMIELEIAYYKEESIKMILIYSMVLLSLELLGYVFYEQLYIIVEDLKFQLFYFMGRGQMLFVEVDSVEKNCKVIVDLEKVIEIAPLINGGCALFFSKDPMIDPARLAMNVKNGYDEFKQFVVQTVSVSDITKRIESLKQFSGSVDEVAKKKPGRPAKVAETI